MRCVFVSMFLCRRWSFCARLTHELRHMNTNNQQHVSTCQTLHTDHAAAAAWSQSMLMNQSRCTMFQLRPLHGFKCSRQCQSARPLLSSHLMPSAEVQLGESLHAPSILSDPQRVCQPIGTCVYFLSVSFTLSCCSLHVQIIPRH